MKLEIDKLDIFTRSCYRIMLGIKQSRDHLTNDSLYYLTGQAHLRERRQKSPPIAVLISKFLIGGSIQKTSYFLLLNNSAIVIEFLYYYY